MSAVIYMEMGNEMAKQGDFDSAALAYCKAIQLNPEYAKAYNNLGLVLRNTGQLYEAEACFRRAIELTPEDAYAFTNLGLVLSDLGFLDKAEECLLQAIEIDDTLPEIYNDLGIVLEEKNQLAEAEQSFRKAIALKLDYGEALYNLGTLLRTAKKLDLAEKYLEQALVIRPGYLEAELSLALLYLLTGRLERGWPSYERTRRKKYGYQAMPIPYWQGEDLSGAAILLFWEYGFGDTIQFVRYVEKVLALTKNIVLWVQKPLEALIKNTYPELTVYSGKSIPPGSFDFACSLLSLPLIFNTTNETVPLPRRYSLAGHESIAKWQQALNKIDAGRRYRVGIVWAGHPKHDNDKKRSIPFAVFADLFAALPVTWVSLQVGDRAQDILNINYPIMDVSNELVDYLETAALISALDLVITVDTSVAHLAGTMGKETWVMLSYDPDWRWQLVREDTPWYKNIKLFRQQSMGDWGEVVASVNAALQEKISNIRNI
ncbi:MAG: tetratricopeptide repeat protein [Pelosinus sp.]|nr:tetratricopeptide repeat protein [Pelosinus sp.]